jgi:hypothetical protein
MDQLELERKWGGFHPATARCGMREVPATTKTAGRDTTWWDPVSKTQTTARAMLLVMARMAMAREYKLPDGEEVYGVVEEVRAWVLAHRAANKRQRRNN